MPLGVNILILLMVASCSGNDEADIDEILANNGEVQLITRLNRENPQDFQRGSQFFYDGNNNLTYIYLDDCSGTLFYFEYNNQNRISRRYEGTTTLSSDLFDPIAFDLDSFLASAGVLNFIYEDNRLVRMEDNDDFIRFNFLYDTNENLITAEQFSPFVPGIWCRTTIGYTDNRISSLNEIQFASNGDEVVSNNDYTFVFDNNPNPFYNLNLSEGLVSLRTCTGYDFITSIEGAYKIFRNNATEIRRNGEIFFTASYQYDDNNYPVRVVYNTQNGNSSTDVITYFPN